MRQALLREDEIPEADGSYKRPWRLLKEFVDGRGGPQPHPIDGLRHYLTRQNVDDYFTEVVPTFTVQPSSVARHRSALQWWADNLEWREEDDYQRFIVDSRKVQRALDKYGCNFLADFTQQNRDIHANIPTNVLTEEDHRRAMSYLFSSNHSFWRDFAISWNVCQASFIRQNTLRKLTLPCICADRGHAPPGIFGENATILSLILPPGVNKEDSAANKSNKESSDKPKRRAKVPTNFRSKVVGFYRHKSVISCSTSMIAISIFTRFHHQETLSFVEDVAEGADGAGTWQYHKIMQRWNTLADNGENGRKATEDAYKTVMEACQISWNKVTHLRSSGMEQASSRGLSADEIATMSKHRKERIFESYMTELYPTVMLVMAGFRKDEAYFCPRTEVDLPDTLDNCIRFCFPKYEDWIRDWNNGRDGGDTHASTRNFLLHVIPFITRVIVQDAPYFLKHYPNHAYSAFIKQKFPLNIWRDWAPTAIEKAKEISEGRALRSVEALNNAAQETYQHQSRVVMAQTAEIQSLNEQVQAIQQSLNAIQTLLSNQAGGNGQPAAAPPANAAPNVAAAAQQQQQVQQQQQQVHVHVNVAGAPAAVQAINNAPNALDELRPSDEPLLPNLPDRLAKTIPEMLHKYDEFELWRYRNSDSTRGWPTKHKMMLEKYMYVHGRLCRKASNPRYKPQWRPTSQFIKERITAAAEDLELERLALKTDRGKPYSVDRWIKHLKATLPVEDGGSRKRKTRGIEGI